MPTGRAKGHRRIGRFEPYYEVAESYLGPLWAVKVISGVGEGHAALLREIPVASAEVSASLAAAAQSGLGVRHGGVLSSVEVLRTDTSVALVMDYLEGETLRSLHALSSIRRRPIEAGVALRVVLDVLEGLSAAQQTLGRTPFAFGGVAPDSIIVGVDGSSRLMDVGVAPATAAVEAIGGQSERVAYLAPEQIDHFSPGVATARTDVFSVGVLLWEMLSNRRLFIGSDRAVAQKVLGGKIPPLDQVKRRGDFELSPALVALVTRALSREPQERFADAREMLDALVATQAGPATHGEVAAFVRAVGEGHIERRLDALRDATGTAETPRLSDAMPATAPSRDEASTPVEGVAALPVERGPTAPKAPPALPGRNPKVMGVPVPPLDAPAPVAPIAAPPRANVPRVAPPAAPSPAVVARPAPLPVAGPAKGPPPVAPARPRMPTMMGVAPPPPASAPMPSPPAPLAQVPLARVPAAAPAPNFARVGASAQTEPVRDSYRPDSVVEPVEAIKFPSARPPGFVPHSPVRPPVQDAMDAGASWPSEITSDPPVPPLASPMAIEEPTGRMSSPFDEPTARVPMADIESSIPPPFPRPPAAPSGIEAPVPSARAPEPFAPPSLGIGTPSRAGTSMPPAAVFASKVPPPLIHDPRAKRQHKQAAPKPFARGVAVGALVAVGVVVLGVGIGLIVVRQQHRDLDEKRASTEEPTPPAPAKVAEPVAEPAAVEPAPPPSAEAPEAASATPPAPSEVPAEPAPTLAPPAPVAAPVSTYRRPAPTKKKKFVPDDI